MRDKDLPIEKICVGHPASLTLMNTLENIRQVRTLVNMIGKR